MARALLAPPGIDKRHLFFCGCQPVRSAVCVSSCRWPVEHHHGVASHDLQSLTVECSGNSHVEVAHEDTRCHTSARFATQMRRGHVATLDTVGRLRKTSGCEHGCKWRENHRLPHHGTQLNVDITIRNATPRGSDIVCPASFLTFGKVRAIFRPATLSHKHGLGLLSDILEGRKGDGGQKRRVQTRDKVGGQKWGKMQYGVRAHN